MTEAGGEGSSRMDEEIMADPVGDESEELWVSRKGVSAVDRRNSFLPDREE